MAFKDSPKNLLFGSLFFLFLAIVGLITLSLDKSESNLGGGSAQASRKKVRSANAPLVEKKGDHYIARLKKGYGGAQTDIQINTGQKYKVILNIDDAELVRENDFYVVGSVINQQGNSGKSYKDEGAGEIRVNDGVSGKLSLMIYKKIGKKRRIMI